MLTAKFALAAATVNGKIYAIGGRGYSGSLNTVEVYDPSSDTWRTDRSVDFSLGTFLEPLAPMPTARYDFAAAVVDGKIYAISGVAYGGPTYDTVEVYDPATNTWSTGAPMPTTAHGLAGAALNGKIYAIGGYNVSFLNTSGVYDPATNTWSTGAPMPTARASLAAAEANGLIYAVGGSRVAPAVFNATERYSPPVTIYTFIKN
jgi:N-acetylneuraminic acid mutarotase